jgi:hypothetical protein
MKRLPALLWLSALSSTAPFAAAQGADVDARPPNRLILSANGVRLTGVDEGGGGSLSYLHYLTPDALIGLGGEHQFIADSKWTFGSLRGAVGFGAPERKTTLVAEMHYGEGDDAGRDFDYSVAVLGLSQAITSKLSIQLEGREIDVDRSNGNLPKIGVTYAWSPQWVTNVSYAESVSGNLETELTGARIDRHGRHVHVFAGGASGRADPVVLNLQPGAVLPVSNLKQGFAGIGRSFSRGEVQLIGDYLESGESERITVTLTYTGYFARAR